MDISKAIAQQEKELSRKLELLRGNNLTELLAEKQSLEDKVAEIESKIAHVCRELDIDLGDVSKGSKAGKAPRGTRMGGAEIEQRILSVLNANPGGLSQKSISDLSGVNYASVINFINAKKDILGSTGERKSKKVFLKK